MSGGQIQKMGLGDEFKLPEEFQVNLWRNLFKPPPSMLYLTASYLFVELIESGYKIGKICP